MAERRGRRGDRSRGVALLEFAFVAPILFALLAAAVDFGFGWRKSMEVAATLRSGARVVSSLGTNRAADYDALRSVNAGMEELGASNVLRVIVYKSNTADGGLPAACDLDPLAGGRGIDNVCNVYGPEQLAGLTSSRFSGSTTACQTDDWDRWYCPLNDREDSQGAGTDYVGIYMEFHIEWLVGVIPGGGVDHEDHAVMRIEPA